MFGCYFYDIYNGRGQRVDTVEALNGHRAKMAYADRHGLDYNADLRKDFKAKRK